MKGVKLTLCQDENAPCLTKETSSLTKETFPTDGRHNPSLSTRNPTQNPLSITKKLSYPLSPTLLLWEYLFLSPFSNLLMKKLSLVKKIIQPFRKNLERLSSCKGNIKIEFFLLFFI